MRHNINKNDIKRGDLMKEAGRPRKFNDNDILRCRVEEYFNYCDEQVKEYEDSKGRLTIIRKPYTLSGLCLWLGICRDTFAEYVNGKYDDINNKFSDTFLYARQKVENYVEEGMLNNTLNTNGSIFNLKNNFNWKDKTEVEHQVTNIDVKISNLIDENKNPLSLNNPTT